MNSIDYIRDSLKFAHEMINMTVADLTSEMAHECPPGVANPIGATYAYALLAEDGVVNGMLRGGAPLFATKFAGNSGASEASFQQTQEWARSVQIDLPKLAEYGKAVAAETDSWLASLGEDDLNK